MSFWFVTQDPKVLDYGELGHGVWVHKRFKDSNHSGRGLKINDNVVIYEVGNNEKGTIRNGTKAVVALSRVTQEISGGKKEGKFIKLAEAQITATFENGIPTAEVLNILEGKTIDKSLFGTYILKYSGKVWETSLEQFREFEKYLTSKSDDEYQQEVELATPQAPPESPQEPKYVNQGKILKLTTDSKLAKYCVNKSEYKCEANSNHNTFISKNTGRNYVEVHHLIPLKYQPEFNKALDNHANIISLCPNCHRLIHHATLNDKKDCLEQLFEKERMSALRGMGIEVTLNQIFAYYS